MKRPKMHVFDPVAPAPRRCYFCKATTDLVRCTQQIVGPVKVFADNLTETDYIYTLGGKELKPLTVRLLRDRRGIQTVMYALDYDELTGWGRTWIFYKSVHERLTILRPRACMIAACELHRCERGPKSIYCANHWTFPDVRVAPRRLVDPLRSRATRKLEKVMEAAACR